MGIFFGRFAVLLILSFRGAVIPRFVIPSAAQRSVGIFFAVRRRRWSCTSFCELQSAARGGGEGPAAWGVAELSKNLLRVSFAAPREPRGPKPPPAEARHSGRPPQASTRRRGHDRALDPHVGTPSGFLLRMTHRRRNEHDPRVGRSALLRMTELPARSSAISLGIPFPVIPRSDRRRRQESSRAALLRSAGCGHRPFRRASSSRSALG